MARLPIIRSWLKTHVSAIRPERGRPRQSLGQFPRSRRLTFRPSASHAVSPLDRRMKERPPLYQLPSSSWIKTQIARACFQMTLGAPSEIYKDFEENLLNNHSERVRRLSSSRHQYPGCCTSPCCCGTGPKGKNPFSECLQPVD